MSADSAAEVTGYRALEFATGNASHMHRHFLPAVLALCGRVGPGVRVLDVGCGNGFSAGQFLAKGCEVVGIDLSESGIAPARKTFVSCITPLVLTFNEAPNLERTLAQLSWAPEVIVLDSFSTDQTPSIAARFANVRVVQRTFDTHAAQWNAGVAECTTDWVLALDADYVLSPELVEELRSWRPDLRVSAYLCNFRYCVEGVALRGSLYPPRAVLFQPSKCRYVQNGHTQLLQVVGASAWLKQAIFHDDRKPLSRWLANQDRYAKLEAEKLLAAPTHTLRWRDRWRRLIVPAPFLVFVTTLIGKGLILDGWRGWYYACQRTLAELMLSLRLVDARLQKR